MPKRIINVVYLIVIFVLFYLILRDEMVNMVINVVDDSINVVSRYYIVLVFILLVCHTIFFSRRIKNKISTNIKLLMGMIFLLTLFHSIKHPLSSNVYYILITLPILFFNLISDITYCTKNNKVIFSVFICIVVLLIINYFATWNIRRYESHALTSNSSYVILYFLPFILCLEKRLLRYFAILLIFTVVILSFKRGAFISIICGVSIYMLMEFITNNRRSSFSIYGVAFIFVLILYYIFTKVDGFTDHILLDRFSNVESDGGSGRFDIYSNTISMISDSNIFRLLFGHGWDAVKRDSVLNLSAHNDLLEILYNFGIIVFGIYIHTMINLIRFSIKLIKTKSQYASAFAASIVIFLIMSNISHIIIYSTYMSIFCIFWGYILAQTKKVTNCN